MTLQEDQERLNAALRDFGAQILRTFEPTLRRLLRAVDDVGPQVTEQWAVVDRWWTDDPAQAHWIAIRVDGHEAILRYDRKTSTFELGEDLR